MVTSGAPLKMRSELTSILESGDPTQVAFLYAPFQAASNTDIDLGESLWDIGQRSSVTYLPEYLVHVFFSY